MSRATSTYLDLWRFFAAVIVFASHASAQFASGGLFWWTGLISQEAVLVFFVLSGFVIAHVVENREASAKTYLINRSARIYSVALPALVLTFILDIVSQSVRPALFAGLTDFSADDRGWQSLNGLFFTSQSWFNQIRIGTNFPYWSISFEVWYYIAFGLIFYLPARLAMLAGCLALLLAGPRIAVLFPIWLMGVGAYHLARRNRLPPRAGVVLLAMTVLLIIAARWQIGAKHPLHAAFATTPEHLAGYLYYCLVAALFAGHLVAFQAQTLLRFPKFMPGLVRWLGERTFSLYLYHMPLLFFAASIMPWPPESLSARLLIFLGVPAVTFLLAEVTERRKQAWRNGIGNLVNRFSPAGSPRPTKNA